MRCGLQLPLLARPKGIKHNCEELVCAAALESVEPSELALKLILNTTGGPACSRIPSRKPPIAMPKSVVDDPNQEFRPLVLGLKTTAEGQREKTRKISEICVPNTILRRTPCISQHSSAYPRQIRPPLPHPTRASTPSLLSICHRPIRLRPLAAPSLRIPMSRRRRLHRHPLARLPAEGLHVGPVLERLREVADAARDVFVALYRERNDGL